MARKPPVTRLSTELEAVQTMLSRDTSLRNVGLAGHGGQVNRPAVCYAGFLKQGLTGPVPRAVNIIAAGAA
jgi:hypothetical protein